jgi:hypothetical protein
MNVVVRQLIGKELRMHRVIMSIALVSGLAALAIGNFGRIGYALGGILFISAGLGSGIIIGMYGIVQERKDQAHLFAASLPVSPTGLMAAKFFGCLLAFTIPWLALTLAGVALILLSPAIPDGAVIYTLVIQGFIFAIVLALYAAVLGFSSEAASGAGVFGINILFSLFMVGINQPMVRDQLTGPEVRWTTEVAGLLMLDAVIVTVALLSLLLLSRRRNFI